MNWIKDLRTACGLSQTKLCYWLQVPKSTLAMAESGQRELSPKSQLKFTGLYLAMLQPELVAGAAEEKPAPLEAWCTAALGKKLRSNIEKLRFETTAIEKRIHEWETRQRQRRQMRLLLLSLGHLHEVHTPTEQDAHWLRRRKEDLQAIDETENNYEYRLLLLRRELQQLEAEKMEELMQELEQEYAVDKI